MDEVDLLLQEAYNSVRQKTTDVKSAKAELEKKRDSPKGVTEPKKETEKDADGKPKNVKGLFEGTRVPDLDDEDDAPTSAFDSLASRILNEEYDAKLCASA